MPGVQAYWVVPWQMEVKRKRQIRQRQQLTFWYSHEVELGHFYEAAWSPDCLSGLPQTSPTSVTQWKWRWATGDPYPVRIYNHASSEGHEQRTRDSTINPNTKKKKNRAGALWGRENWRERDSWAWNIYLSMLHSDHLCDHSMAVRWLWRNSLM